MRNMPTLTDPKLRPAIDELLSYESHQAKSAVQRLRFLEFPSSPPLPETSSKCDAQKQKAPQIIDLQGFYC